MLAGAAAAGSLGHAAVATQPSGAPEIKREADALTSVRVPTVQDYPVAFGKVNVHFADGTADHCLPFYSADGRTLFVDAQLTKGRRVADSPLALYCSGKRKLLAIDESTTVFFHWEAAKVPGVW